jgi:hypothetical protein
MDSTLLKVVRTNRRTGRVFFAENRGLLDIPGNGGRPWVFSASRTVTSLFLEILAEPKFSLDNIRSVGFLWCKQESYINSKE